MIAQLDPMIITSQNNYYVEKHNDINMVKEKSRKRRTALLNAANRDIQRALDLEPFNSELFWTKAIIQYQSGENADQVIDTFLNAFDLHPNLQESLPI